MSANWKKFERQTADAKFVLLEFLGAGERSAVFRTDRPDAAGAMAALKMIPFDAATAEIQLSRWKQAERFAHANLLKIFASGQAQFGAEKFLYVVEECAEEDLSQILPQRPLTPEETRGMLGPVLDALDYLHGRSCVHAHLKPANIMAIGDQVKLSADGTVRAGEAGGGKGKLSAYDPPEASSGRLTTASDIWSLGMTLSEVLTQRLPVWERLGQEEPRLPDGMPAPFGEIASRCLAREPLGRWRVEEVAARLGHKLSGAAEKPRAKAATAASPAAVAPPVPPAAAVAGARPPSPSSQPSARKAPRGAVVQSAPEKPQRTAGSALLADKHKQNFALAAAAILLLVIGILEAPRLLKHDPDARPVAELASQTAAAETASPPAREPERVSAKEDASANNSAEAPRPAGKKREAAKSVPPPQAAAPPPEAAQDSPSAPNSTNSTNAAIASGQVTHQEIPRVPRSAMDTIHGTVRVRIRVKVGDAGNVTQAAFDSPGPSQYFARLAMQAAQKWTFAPPQSGSPGAPADWVLHFEFTSSATRVHPVPVTAK
jgi:TonB family protein